MAQEYELIQALRRFASVRGVEIGAVTAVEADKGLCSVEIDEIVSTKVRLGSVIDEGNNRFYLIPKQGSSVLVSQIEGDPHRRFVVGYSDIDSLKVAIEKTQLQVNAEGFLVKRDGETLGKLIDDLITAIQAMKFTTNQGPTINLVNTADFNRLSNRFKTLLKHD